MTHRVSEGLVERCGAWLHNRGMPNIVIGYDCTMAESLGSFVQDEISKSARVGALENVLRQFVKASLPGRRDLDNGAIRDEFYARQNEARRILEGGAS